MMMRRKMSKYHCDKCDKDVDDLGSYEMEDGDYCCQRCYENILARAEAYWDSVVKGE